MFCLNLDYSDDFLFPNWLVKWIKCQTVDHLVLQIQIEEYIMLEKVFIVVKSIAYEGDTVMRVFANYKNAVKYAEELAAADTSNGYFEYDVFEREIY